MQNGTILTIDIGTSSTKTALWSVDGILIAEAMHAYPLNRPEPLWAEIKGEVWWEAVCGTIKEVLRTGNVQPEDVKGIGVDGVSWTLLPVDHSGHPLTPAMIWLDRRAIEQTEALKNHCAAEAMLQSSANPIDPAYITPKLLWLKENQPEIFDQARYFMGSTGYIVSQFTGEYTCDFTQAYGYHFFDMQNACWNTEIAEAVGIPLEKMPRLCAPSDVVGVVTQKAAVQTGLCVGTPVIAGCLDAATGALGAGVTLPGQTNEQGGQAGGMGISVEQVVVEPRLIFSHHVIPGQYLLQGGTVGGGALGWFRDQNVFELFSLQASLSKPGANGLIFLPYLAGERTPLWSNTVRGTFFGLSYSSTRADMLRAIMEGVAFSVLDNLQVAQEHGVTFDSFLGSGGATNSPVWCQIKADVYGKPFIVARRSDGGEGGHGLGLFALTAYGVGLCDDIGACVRKLLPKQVVYEPNLQNHASYLELFNIYHSVSRKLLADFNALDHWKKNYSSLQ